MAHSSPQDIEALTNAEEKVNILRILHDEPHNQVELADRLSVSRTTIGRKLSKLEGQDWIQHSGNGYDLTTVGRLILRECDQFISSIKTVAKNTMSNVDGYEIIDYFSSSEKHIRVLRVLHDQSARQNEVIDRASVSRSTVYRALTEFSKRGWVEKDPSTGGYTLTILGEKVAQAYDQLLTAVTVINECKSYLLMLKAENLEIPVDALAAATVTVASQDQPHKVIVRFMERMMNESPSTFKSMSPVVSEVYNTTLEPFVSSGVSMELILDEETLALSASQTPEDLGTARTADNIDLYIHPHEIPFGLMLVDENRGMLGAFDEEGNHRGSLTGTDPSLVSWIDEIYKRYKREACHIDEFNPENNFS